jgi:hypothetical protein
LNPNPPHTDSPYQPGGPPVSEEKKSIPVPVPSSRKSTQRTSSSEIGISATPLKSRKNSFGSTTDKKQITPMKSVVYMSPLKSAKKPTLRFIPLEAMGAKGKGERDREESEVGGETGGCDDEGLLSQSRKSRRRRFVLSYLWYLYLFITLLIQLILKAGKPEPKTLKFSFFCCFRSRKSTQDLLDFISCHFNRFLHFLLFSFSSVGV